MMIMMVIVVVIILTKEEKLTEQFHAWETINSLNMFGNQKIEVSLQLQDNALC